MIVLHEHSETQIILVKFRLFHKNDRLPLQVLLEREGTCHRTCYSLQLEGKSLDHFTEIRNVPGLKSGSTLAVVEGTVHIDWNQLSIDN